MKIMRSFLPLLLVGASLVGCSKKESPSTAEQPPGGSPEPTATSPAPSAEHVAGEGEQISTEGSASNIMARVEHEETELQQIIDSARLKDVHRKAFAIRDLVIAAADKATVSGSDRTKLEEHVARVKSLASELDESGDSGDLSKTKAGFTDLRAELQGIKQLLGAGY